MLRADRETLLSVLETFVHDPLVDWARSHSIGRAGGSEADNPQAVDALATIAGAPPALRIQPWKTAHE